MSFASPLVLLSLLLLPLLLFGYRLLLRRQTRYAVSYTNLDVLAGVVATHRSWRRHLGLALLLLALASLLVGFARPSMMRLADREEATIVLVIDVSGSMDAKDVRPTRLEAARVVVHDFLATLPKRYRVGVIAFAEAPEVISPITDDREAVVQSLDYLYTQRGTAIGDAVARAVELVRAEPAVTADASGKPPVAVLLLSDGEQTEGFLEPSQGAQRAKSFRIPVHTIAFGTPEGVVELSRFGFVRVIPVPPDPVTLNMIATTTGGKFYAAGSERDLREAYGKLGSLVSKVERKQEVTVAFVGLGAVLLLAAAAVSALTFPRLP
jgi:Ca-activated chloride channel homolog